jgi:uncharacterized protein (TIGR02996 family)
MTMTDSQSFLAAIQAAPDDPQPRLTYADWLEWDAPAELRDPERAEFIRAQLELAEDKWHEADPKQFLTPDLKYRDEDYKRHPLVIRMNQLRKIESDWLDRNREKSYESEWSRGFMVLVRCTEQRWVGGECERCHGRGQVQFINGQPLTASSGNPFMVQCPECNGAGRVVGIGPRLVSEHTIEQVVVKNKRPSEQVGVWMLGDASCTTGPDEARLAKEVFRLLEGGLEVSPGVLGFPTQKAALDAMSKAYIDWARNPAGQPSAREARGSNRRGTRSGRR